MFYIIETENQLKRLESIIQDPVYIDVISSNDNFHPKLTDTVGVYIRNIKEGEGYIIPIDHNDSLNIEKQRIYQLLLKAEVLYTLDKKTLLYHFNLQGAIDLSLLYSMTFFNKLEYSTSNSTIDWYYAVYGDSKDINKIIPITKLYERCENVVNQINNVFELQLPQGFKFYNDTATNVFFLIEQNGIGVEPDAFKQVFEPKNLKLNTVNNVTYTKYNLYNSTSRPTNSFNSVNFAAIPKTEQHRRCFKPQNDFFVEFDFDGYHLRLLADQIQYPLTQESAHIQLARTYFDKKEITEEEYTKAKQINFQAIYGKIPDQHKDVEIFKQIQEYITEMWNMFNEEGFVSNPMSGKTFTKELQDMNPAKLMNYMMQSLETSNNISILKNLLRYLKDKKTFITLFTYDAILFDFSKEDSKQTLEDIKEIMETNGKFPVKFKYNTNLLL